MGPRKRFQLSVGSQVKVKVKVKVKCVTNVLMQFTPGGSRVVEVLALLAKHKLTFFPTTTSSTTLPKYQNLFSVTTLDSFLLPFQLTYDLPLLQHAPSRDAITYRPSIMSDQALVAAQPFPPGLSRLERLPDELKLRIGYYLMTPVPAKVADEPNVHAESDGYDWSDASHWQQTSTDDLYKNAVGDDIQESNDSMLALACTSTALCDVFLNEHCKKYGLQNTLYRSIELGSISLVHRAVEDGADINKAGTEPYRLTPLQLAVDSEQLPVVIYLLRRGVAKVDEVVMDALRDRDYHREINEEHDFQLDPPRRKNRCLCSLIQTLMDATFGSNQTPPTKPLLPREVQEALVPNGLHLWFILRTCMRREWGCDCGDNEDEQCPMRLISLLQRHGASWMSCGAHEIVPQQYSSWYSLYNSVPELTFLGATRHLANGRGAADMARLWPQRRRPVYIWSNDGNPYLLKPSVSGALDDALLENTAYKRDHCLSFLTAILEHGIAAEDGDLVHAMNLSSDPADGGLSIAIVRVLLQGGTDPNEPGAMKTAMRLACMEATQDAGLALATLLLEHGADPREEELRDEIQGAAEKWWVQSAWQSAGVFRRILRLLVDGGLEERVAGEILAVLGLDHDVLGEEGGESVEL